MAPMEYSTNKKALWPQWNISPWFIVAIGKTWFYERLFFEVVIIMVKDKKYSAKDTMSIKISFMHYMKWARVMFPVVFEKFEDALMDTLKAYFW